MSLINQILGQQVIPLTVGLAVLMLFAAIVLAIVPRVKAARVRRAKAKAERLAAAAARAAAMMDESDDDELAARARVRAQMDGEESGEETPTKGKKSASSGGKAGSPTAPGAKPPTADGKPTVPGAKPAIPSGPPAAAAAAPAKVEEKKDEPSPEMQDLLSSVFSDEESAERQAKLLKGMENVEIEHLLTLCNTVMGQIRGEDHSIVVKIKENQLQ